MQGQQAGGAVERARRGAVDITVMQRDARRVAGDPRGGGCQHLGRGVDAGEAPARLPIGESPQFQPTPGTEDQDLCRVPSPFGQQNGGHLLQVQKPRHLTNRPLGVTCDGLRVGEGGYGVSPSGSGRLLARQQAVSVLASRQAMVIGPTPPGTGVIAPATSATEA